jgi:hypothetical protein
MNTASLIRKYGKGKAWDRAGLYFLNPAMPQLMRGGGHEYITYVMVQVHGDTVDMYESDANGQLTGGYARWAPLTRDDGEARGVFMTDELTCTAALEAEGYTVVALGEVTA